MTNKRILHKILKNLAFNVWIKSLRNNYLVNNLRMHHFHLRCPRAWLLKRIRAGVLTVLAWVCRGLRASWFCASQDCTICRLDPIALETAGGLLPSLGLLATFPAYDSPLCFLLLLSKLPASTGALSKFGK